MTNRLVQEPKHPVDMLTCISPPSAKGIGDARLQHKARRTRYLEIDDKRYKWRARQRPPTLDTHVIAANCDPRGSLRGAPNKGMSVVRAKFNTPDCELPAKTSSTSCHDRTWPSATSKKGVYASPGGGGAPKAPALFCGTLSPQTSLVGGCRPPEPP